MRSSLSLIKIYIVSYISSIGVESYIKVWYERKKGNIEGVVYTFYKTFFLQTLETKGWMGHWVSFPSSYVPLFFLFFFLFFFLLLILPFFFLWSFGRESWWKPVCQPTPNIYRVAIGIYTKLPCDYLWSMDSSKWVLCSCPMHISQRQLQGTYLTCIVHVGGT